MPRPPPRKVNCARPPRSRPAPTSSRRCATLGLEQTEPRTGDEAVRNELIRRADGYVQADVDAWLALALAAHLGHYRDPAAREDAVGLLTPPVLAHAAVLAELTSLVPDSDMDQLAFTAWLATTEPEAASALAAFLTRAYP